MSTEGFLETLRRDEIGFWVQRLEDAEEDFAKLAMDYKSTHMRVGGKLIKKITFNDDNRTIIELERKLAKVAPNKADEEFRKQRMNTWLFEKFGSCVVVVSGWAIIILGIKAIELGWTKKFNAKVVADEIAHSVGEVVDINELLAKFAPWALIVKPMLFTDNLPAILTDLDDEDLRVWAVDENRQPFTMPGINTWDDFIKKVINYSNLQDEIRDATEVVSTIQRRAVDFPDRNANPRNQALATYAVLVWKIPIFIQETFRSPIWITKVDSNLWKAVPTYLNIALANSAPFEHILGKPKSVLEKIWKEAFRNKYIDAIKSVARFIDKTNEANTALAKYLLEPNFYPGDRQLLALISSGLSREVLNRALNVSFNPFRNATFERLETLKQEYTDAHEIVKKALNLKVMRQGDLGPLFPFLTKDDLDRANAEFDQYYQERFDWLIQEIKREFQERLRDWGRSEFTTLEEFIKTRDKLLEDSKAAGLGQEDAVMKIAMGSILGEQNPKTLSQDASNPKAWVETYGNQPDILLTTLPSVVENAVARIEAEKIAEKESLEDIQTWIDEQNDMLDFEAPEQEEIKRDLITAKEMLEPASIANKLAVADNWQDRIEKEEIPWETVKTSPFIAPNLLNAAMNTRIDRAGDMRDIDQIFITTSFKQLRNQVSVLKLSLGEHQREPFNVELKETYGKQFWDIIVSYFDRGVASVDLDSTTEENVQNFFNVHKIYKKQEFDLSEDDKTFFETEWDTDIRALDGLKQDYKAVIDQAINFGRLYVSEGRDFNEKIVRVLKFQEFEGWNIVFEEIAMTTHIFEERDIGQVIANVIRLYADENLEDIRKNTALMIYTHESVSDKLNELSDKERVEVLRKLFDKTKELTYNLRLERFDPDREPPRLKRRGVQCYVNATMQALYALDNFRDAILEGVIGAGDETVELLRVAFTKMLNRDPRLLTEGLVNVCTKAIETLPEKGDPRVPKKDHDAFYKLLLIGDSGVGKSSLILRFVDDTFSEKYFSTIGVDFKLKNVVAGKNDITARLQVWDTAGQERFRTVTSSYYGGAKGILLVFDLTDMESFENVKLWFGEALRHAPRDAHYIVVGTKSDLRDKISVSTLKARSFANDDLPSLARELGRPITQSKIPYVETSSKNDINVTYTFEQLATLIADADPTISKMPIIRDPETIQQDAHEFLIKVILENLPERVKDEFKSKIARLRGDPTADTDIQLYYPEERTGEETLSQLVTNWFSQEIVSITYASTTIFQIIRSTKVGTKITEDLAFAESELLPTSEALNVPFITNTVIYHEGKTMNTGHYFALVRRVDKWFIVDDAKPIRVFDDLDQARGYANKTLKGVPYLLFLTKGTIYPPPTPSRVFLKGIEEEEVPWPDLEGKFAQGQRKSMGPWTSEDEWSGEDYESDPIHWGRDDPVFYV
jgi:Ras-related protein Rab-1A